VVAGLTMWERSSSVLDAKVQAWRPNRAETCPSPDLPPTWGTQRNASALLALRGALKPRHLLRILDQQGRPPGVD